MRSLRNSFFVKGRFALISGFVVTAFLLGIVITRSTHAQGNEPPEADAGGPYSGSPQQSISLSGSGSWDPDGWITSYSWNFGDGATGSGEIASHSYAAAGSYVVTLTVTDNSGATNSTETTVTIEAQNGPQPVTINFDELPSGALVTNQYLPRVALSATGFSGGPGGGLNGFDLYADPYPPPYSLNHAIISDWHRGSPFYSHGLGDVFLDFALPVNNFTFNILNFRYSSNQAAAHIDVYTNRFYYGTFYIYGGFGQGTIPVTSLRTIPDITGIRIYYPNNYDQFGNFLPLYYDDFNFTPDLDVTITNARVNGSLNGTTQNALVGAEIVLNASVIPSNASGGSYSWVFTGPYSVSGGSTSSSSVTIRSTDTGTLMAKVTYTKNGFTTSQSVTINVTLPRLTAFAASIADQDRTLRVKCLGDPSFHTEYTLASRCWDGTPVTESGIFFSTSAQIDAVPYLTDLSKSGIKFKQGINVYRQIIDRGSVKCLTARTSQSGSGWQLDLSPTYNHTAHPPRRFSEGYNLSMNDFDSPGNDVQGIDILNVNTPFGFDALFVDDRMEMYVYYFAGDNPDQPVFEVPLKLVTESASPIDRVAWGWGGQVVYDPSVPNTQYRRDFSSTQLGPVYASGTSNVVSFSSVFGVGGGGVSAFVQCPNGPPLTTNPIDGARCFVRQQYSDFLHRPPDQGGWDYWTGKITDCVFNSNCIIARRNSVAHAFFDSAEFQQTDPAMANPPGSPGFNPSVYNPAFVRHCYVNFLGREPDSGGSSFWTDVLNRTGDYDGVINAFITSSEYRNRAFPPCVSG